MTFEDLNLIAPILQALKLQGYDKPTPIQAQSIPVLLQGRDLLGCAQTGTGKTCAFVVPILQLLSQKQAPNEKNRKIKALIVTPTRELALQIDESIRDYGKYLHLRHTVIFGGVKQSAQTHQLQKGIDILTATPGRLLDLMGQGYINLSDIEFFVLDEADRMLDMGFIHDVRRIIAQLPANRQSLYFSATMPREIVELSEKILRNPAKVSVTPPSSTAERIDQAVYYVDRGNKNALLLHLLNDSSIGRVLVFTRTKHGANKVAKVLNRAGIGAEPIHGNKSQAARVKALEGFKSGQLRALVATDIAARGIDIDELSHVVQFDLPNVPETYVHRIGRTGRAGAAGMAISFCEADDRPFLRDIQRLIRKDVPVINDHPFPPGSQKAALPSVEAAEAEVDRARGNGRRKPESGQENRSQNGGRNGRSEGRRPQAESNQEGRGQNGNRNGRSDRRKPGQPQGRKPEHSSNPRPQNEAQGQQKPATASADDAQRKRRKKRRGKGGTNPNGAPRTTAANVPMRGDDRPEGFRGGIQWD